MPVKTRKIADLMRFKMGQTKLCHHPLPTITTHNQPKYIHYPHNPPPHPAPPAKTYPPPPTTTHHQPKYKHVGINFDQYLQLTSLWQEKMLSIDISHIYGGSVEIGIKTSSIVSKIWRLIHGGYWLVSFIHELYFKFIKWERMVANDY